QPTRRAGNARPGKRTGPGAGRGNVRGRGAEGAAGRSMTTQLRLVWPPSPDYTAESFVASDSSREAREALSAWRDWPGRAMTLVGPAGSGKSHLAKIWLGETGVNSG